MEKPMKESNQIERWLENEQIAKQIAKQIQETNDTIKMTAIWINSHTYCMLFFKTRFSLLMYAKNNIIA